MMKLNAFSTSGSSPTILKIRQQIEAAFERARSPHPAPTPSLPPIQNTYTEGDEARFAARAERLISRVASNPGRARSGVYHIVVPSESVDQLVEEFIRGRE